MANRQSLATRRFRLPDATGGDKSPQGPSARRFCPSLSPRKAPSPFPRPQNRAAVRLPTLEASTDPLPPVVGGPIRRGRNEIRLAAGETALRRTAVASPGRTHVPLLFLPRRFESS